LKSVKSSFPRYAWPAILAALLAAYFPAIIAHYVHNDDYFLAFGRFPASELITFASINGRPLAGIAFASFSLADSLVAMNFLRFLSILNLSVLGWLLYRILKRDVPNDLAALSIAVAALTIPPVATNVGYLATAPFGFGCTLSTIAFLLVPRYRIPAMLLLLASLCLYQPSGLFYLVLVGLATYHRWDLSSLRTHAVILGLPCVLYYIGWRIYLTGFPVEGKYDPRNAPGDPIGRLAWFFQTPLVEASNLWFVQPLIGISLIVFAIIGVALWRARADWKQALVMALLLPATFGASLASPSPTPEYRTYVPLGVLIALLFLISVYRLAPRALPAIALCGIVAAHVTMRTYFTEPGRAEIEFLKDQIQQFRRVHSDDFSHIHVNLRDAPVAVGRHNELGEPTLHHGPNVGPMIHAVLAELGSSQGVGVSVSTPDKPNAWLQWENKLNGAVQVGYYVRHQETGIIVIDAAQLHQLSW